MATTDFIAVYDNALDRETCQELIDIFESSAHRQPGRTGGGVDLEKKRSIDIDVNQDPNFHTSMKRVTQVTTRCMADYLTAHYFAVIGATGIALPDPQTGQNVTLNQQNFESIGRPNMPRLMQALFRPGSVNAQKYEQSTGGYPHWHSEVYPELPDNEALHRILFYMYYLNDIQDGGETEFFYQQRSIEPRAGRMVVAPAYFTHTHRGNTPRSADKYILTSWVLYNSATRI
ncbi:MAG: 2OG-Fe(II) oxygenase, partial [Planctomycetaceae bacterium]